MIGLRLGQKPQRVIAVMPGIRIDKEGQLNFDSKSLIALEAALHAAMKEVRDAAGTALRVELAAPALRREHRILIPRDMLQSHREALVKAVGIAFKRFMEANDWNVAWLMNLVNPYGDEVLPTAGGFLTTEFSEDGQAEDCREKMSPTLLGMMDKTFEEETLEEIRVLGVTFLSAKPYQRTEVMNVNRGLIKMLARGGSFFRAYCSEMRREKVTVRLVNAESSHATIAEIELDLTNGFNPEIHGPRLLEFADQVPEEFVFCHLESESAGAEVR